MSRKPLTDKEGEVRPLASADFKRMRPAKEALSPELYGMMVAHKKKRGQRGKQKVPVKEQVTLRLDGEVVRYFRMSGSGWQSRINAVLKAIVATAPHS